MEIAVLELLLLVLLGLAVGAFGTLVGAGGGFILVPALLVLFPAKEADTITAMSLLVVFANAASGTGAYAFQRRVDFRSGVLFAAATLPGAVLGAFVVGYLPRRAFELIFALVLVAIAVYVLRPRGPAEIREPVRGRWAMRRQITDRRGDTFRYTYKLHVGAGISAGVGFLSSLLGIGGGIIHVPMMAVVLRFPVHIATATSHFVLAGIALEATLVHLATGTLTWDRSLAQAAALALGAVAGAQAGARLAPRVGGVLIIRALAGALLVVALRLGLHAAGL